MKQDRAELAAHRQGETQENPLQRNTLDLPESADVAMGDETSEPSPEATPVQLSWQGQQMDDVQLKAIVEAVLYITDEPLSGRQIADVLGVEAERVQRIIDELVVEYQKPEHGIFIREVAEGYAVATKPELHEQIRNFVKRLQPPLKLSRAALETLAVIAYKQPITAPEIMEIRGVQGLSVLKTLLERKLITTAGRKPVVGRPILYKTTKEFLKQFGLKSLADLPTLKEFEELARVALSEAEEVASTPSPDGVRDREPAGEQELAEADLDTMGQLDSDHEDDVAVGATGAGDG